MTISVDHEQAAPFVDAVNTFYGCGGIPIGVVGPGGVVEKSAFLAMVDEKDADGRFLYPHDLLSGRSAPSATAVLRKTLAAQPDHSVDDRASRLLHEPGPTARLARGRTLADDRRRVGPEQGQTALADGRRVSPRSKAIADIKEYNIVRDIQSARMLADRWPTAMVYSGFEIGIALPYPATSIERDYRYVPHHPVSEAYIKRNPPPHNRPTWDLTSVLVAVLGDRGYFDESPAGKVTVEADGSTRFEASSQGSHRYLILRPEQKPRVLEALVQLSSQPPMQARPARP